MTDLAPASLRGSSALGATLRHARYVISENPVTGVAFGMFVLIVLAALLGPSLVPYDPLASNTDVALKPPSVRHWFGTDQLGRDVFSRVIVAAQLDFFIAVASVALVFVMGGLAGVAAGFLGRPECGADCGHHHGVPTFRARHGHRRGARQHGAEHHPRHRNRKLSALCPGRAGRGQCAP
jgi:hypothetical protein